MVLACIFAWYAMGNAWNSPARAGQDPHDPLIFCPGMQMGSRLQYGINVMPADWSYSGSLSERSDTDDKLKGFHILALSRPGSDDKRTAPDNDGFSEIPCEFMGTTPVVTVFSQDGQKHRFTIDTGAVRSYMQVTMARSLNYGKDDPLPLCLYLPNDKWIHFKAEVDRSIAVLNYPNPDFPVDGIIGMNAISCLQLKIDYQAKKLWARVSSKPIEAKLIWSEFGVSSATKRKYPILAVPMKRSEQGRYSVDIRLGDKSLSFEVDTGASVLGLPPSTVRTLDLDKVGEGQVLVQNGAKMLSKYLAKEARLGVVRFLWPVVHEGVDPRASLGGFGPSVLPNPQVIIDYPGQRLFTPNPTENELVEQAFGQLISGAVKISHDEVVLNMPDVVGPSKAILTKVQDQPVAPIMRDIRLLLNGDTTARARLLALFKELNAPKGHLTIVQDGTEATVEVGRPGPIEN